jgi:hypothetical protein
MKTFSRELMNKLYELNVIIDMNEHREDLNNFTNTNFAQEQKIKGTRTREEVEKHSARGLAAEIALIDIGFVSNSLIVKDVTTIDFANRMTDLCVEGFNIAVKSKKSIYDKFYINQKQHKSISDSKQFNDFFLIMNSDNLGNLKFSINTHFLVDAFEFLDYIKPNIYAGSGESPFVFRHDRAYKDNVCIDFKELENV